MFSFQLAELLRNGLVEEGESLRVVFEVQKHILDPISHTAYNLRVRTRLLAIALVPYLPAAILPSMKVIGLPSETINKPTIKCFFLFPPPNVSF